MAIKRGSTVTVIALHKCEIYRADKEPGGPLRMTPCLEPARLYKLTNGEGWLCEKHAGEFDGRPI